MTYFGNSVPKIYTTQEFTNQFTFVYMIAKSIYITFFSIYFISLRLVIWATQHAFVEKLLKKCVNPLLGTASTQKLVEIHNTKPLINFVH